MDSKDLLLEIDNLHVDFHSAEGKTHILKGVNLKLHQGEAVAIVGESGSGKSVTALAIMQLLGKSGCISQGRILFNGMSLTEMNQKEMQAVRGKKIGMVFQDPLTALNPTMTVGDQIAEGIYYHEKISHKSARLRALDLLKKVGIADPIERMKAYPFQLSGGMRQRIVIAIALSCCPLMLIADEPTTALDVTIQAQILDLISRICKDTHMSLLLITHDLGVVAGICDRAAVMYNGKIVEEGDVNQLFYSPEHHYTQNLISRKSSKIFNV